MWPLRMWQEPRARYDYLSAALAVVLLLPSSSALVETTSVSESGLSATPIADPRFGLAAGGYMNFDVEISDASPRFVCVCSISAAGVGGPPDFFVHSVLAVARSDLAGLVCSAEAPVRRRFVFERRGCLLSCSLCRARCQAGANFMLV